MKETLLKIWQGFFFGIGFAIAWWLIFGLLSYTVFDRFYNNLIEKPAQHEQASEQNDIKKQLHPENVKRYSLPSER